MPLPIHPDNPVARAFRHGGGKSTPFIYYHTHVVTSERVQASFSRSIEFDVYVETVAEGSAPKARIQHPPRFYRPHTDRPLPPNLPLSDALDLFEKGDSRSVLVLDAKSRAALPHIRGLVARLGVHRVLVHAFATELVFSAEECAPPPEPHEEDENVPLADVVEAASPEGGTYRAAVLLTCRNAARELSGDGVDEGARRCFETIERATAGKGVDVVGLWLQPGGVAPPPGLVRRLADEAGLLVSFNVDSDTAAELDGLPYVGMTDVLEHATRCDAGTDSVSAVLAI